MKFVEQDMLKFKDCHQRSRSHEQYVIKIFTYQNNYLHLGYFDVSEESKI